MLLDVVLEAVGLPGFATLGDPALGADTDIKVLDSAACELG